MFPSSLYKAVDSRAPSPLLPILFRIKSELVGAYKAHCPGPCLSISVSCPLPPHSAPATPPGLLSLPQLESKLPEGPPSSPHTHHPAFLLFCSA